MLLYIVDTATLDTLDHFVLRLCLRTLMQATVLYHLSLNTIDDDGPYEHFVRLCIWQVEYAAKYLLVYVASESEMVQERKERRRKEMKEKRDREKEREKKERLERKKKKAQKKERLRKLRNLYWRRQSIVRKKIQ